MVSEESTYLPDEESTREFGKKLAPRIASGGCVFLHGDLGAGKTTLVRGILQGLGYDGKVRSPTYTLVERYDTAFAQVCHFDLYRLGHPEELDFIGARDDITSTNLCLIEWPNRGEGWLSEPNLDIYLTFETQLTEKKEKMGRQIRLSWHNHYD